MSQAIFPIDFNFTNIRTERQKVNNLAVYQSLIQKSFNKKFINEEELKRVLEDLELSEIQLLDKCAEDYLFAKVLSRDIAKNASRQGSKDESTQLEICNLTSSKFGIYIEDLPNFSFRPTKDGRIITKKEFDLLDKNSCLKSFDGRIHGLINGWIFAKVVYGLGGHQDNVFEEAHNYSEWVCNFGKEDQIYVVLIDTNLDNQFNELKNKYLEQKNLLIVNHVEFQLYIIKNFNLI